MFQSAFPLYPWARVRPCTVIAFAPAFSIALATSTAFTEDESHPLRIFTVTGTDTFLTTPLTISYIFSGFLRRALPA